MKSSTIHWTVISLLHSLGSCQDSSLPQVDLGYEIHQASSYNETGQTYSFNNIRYAQAPVGELRFAAPVPPTGRNPEVQNGSFTPICPQAYPFWQSIGEAFTEAFAVGMASEFNYTQAAAAVQAQTANLSLTDLIAPGTTEDCLFLDVVVPKSIFECANNMRRKRHGSKGAPVLVWIYGGGYVLGDKYDNGGYNPAGLIAASQRNGGEGIVYVAMNYRLGAMGWLAGPTLQEAGGVSNAGLYDQRLALEWVQNNIHLFGGDPSQVTIMGESAGGGSVMHQITAYAGQQPVPFQRAIPQSPGWFPITSTYIQENDTATFLGNLNVTSIEEARNASSMDVIIANLLTVGHANYGTYVFGPVVDGIFVTTQPGLALLNGGFAKNVSVLPAHNTNEGPLFTPPYVRTDDELRAWLKFTFPSVQPPVVDYFLQELYPGVYDGTYPWRSMIERTITIVTELIFTCNTNYLARAYNNQTHNLQFEIPPAVHGIDVPSTFYNGQPLNLSLALVPADAEVMQGYYTNFVMTGDPNGEGLPYFPIQGSNATEIGINITISANGVEPLIQVQQDPTANSRCHWLQKALYL